MQRNKFSATIGFNSSFPVISDSTRPFQTRSFLNFANPLASATSHSQLKSLERTANQHANSTDAQFDFVAELARSHPDVVVERYTMPEYVMDERLAFLYLNAMHSVGNYAHFNFDKFLAKLQPMDALQKDAITELAVQSKGLTKSKQVAAVLNILGNPMVNGGGAAGSMSAGMMGGAASRGLDARSPLFVQLQNTTSNRAMLFGFVRQIIIAFLVISALTAVMDEKGVGRAMGMGSSKHIQEAEEQTVKFSDVKGVAEAKAELEEIVEYLKDPSRFTRLGGKLPRGLLLTGPPGTGKTLLAKAIAGEAEVPFFFASGSQFEEVYVGLGAKRVRELFEAAKKKAPAIIFIDEIDAVGGSRNLKDQSALKMTLNELLVQLDGFDENNGIIVIGATNFMESLDSALLRPGRFDKHVSVPLPDVGGRKEILELYSEKTKLSKDVDLSVIARGTTGFSGADLSNLMNQAAVKASVDGLNSITMEVFEYAKDKIMMGAERKTAVISPETAKCTAYHEAGHAIVAVLTDGAMPIHKATIMPRGAALGMVSMLPEGDQTSQSYKEMIAYMDICMGGRVAEELIFGKENITSGAASDIQQATNVARAMVTKYGFSSEVGIVFHDGNVGEASASPETRARIDEEVKKMTQASYDRAKDTIKKYHKAHHLLAQTLLEYETLTGDEVRDIVTKGKKPKRAVINTQKGSRGDNSVLKTRSSSSARGTIKGWGRTRQEEQ
jgi:ATP-dependent metalloprotease